MDAGHQGTAAVVALAGRRVDAPDTNPPRFPLDAAPDVRRQIADMLAGENAATLVCSAACGADLLALAEAERLGMRRRIVLPFPPERFRDTSVTDRPGDWGPLFDRLIDKARGTSDLVVIDAGGDAAVAYAAANAAIVREALAIAEAGPATRRVALVVWEGTARASGDATEEFRQLAAAAGFEGRSILTIER